MSSRRHLFRSIRSSAGTKGVWYVLGIFAVIGIAAIISTGAATSVLTHEPEQGTLTNPAETVDDPAASAGKSVLFKGLSAGAPALEKSVVAGGLTNPWDIGFGGGNMFITERPGAIKAVLPGGNVRQLLQVEDVIVAGEGGLLGLAVDPDFTANRYIYACFASRLSGTNDVRLVRWTVNADVSALTSRKDLVTGMPYGTGRHSGCRPRFAPDGYLWIGTGDVAVGTNPQSKTSLGGKVLRVDREGVAAPGNAGNGFDARIYSYGHRNVQGLAFRPGNNQAFDVEHGPTRDDELNLLRAGGNYGWDPVPGYNESVPMTDTVKFPSAIVSSWSSGATTIAPSGSTFLQGNQWKDWNGALAMAVLKGTHLRIMTLNAAGTAVTAQVQVLQQGIRLRSAVQGPDGNLYITTDVGAGGGEVWKIVPN